MRKVREFAGDRRGTFAVAGAIAAPILALAMGVSIDVAQLVHVRSTLQAALDAAITSTARDLTTGRIKEKDARKSVENFLLVNSESTLLKGETVTLGNLVVNRTTKSVSADASVNAAMLFPLFGLAERRQVNASSAALYSDKKIEITMMLDTTGSMKDRNKLADLKVAANNAVDGMLQNVDSDNPRIRLSIVPYAASVNAGALAADAVYTEPTGSVFVPPGVNPNLPLPLLDSVPLLLRAPIQLLTALLARSDKDNCATERKLAGGEADLSDDAPDAERTYAPGKYRYPAKVNRDNRLDIGACPTASVVPLTANKEKLKRTIRDFTPSGSTAGAIALQWGYYMLSPDWRSAVRDADLGNGPADYNSKKTSKIAVLMTDGLFNTAYTGSDLTSKSTTFPVETKALANAAALCESMKEKGIEIYTVGFALDPAEKSSARRVLSECASPNNSIARKHFFDAATGEELDDAFQEIIANAERLAVTK